MGRADPVADLQQVREIMKRCGSADKGDRPAVHEVAQVVDNALQLTFVDGETIT